MVILKTEREREENSRADVLWKTIHVSKYFFHKNHKPPYLSVFVLAVLTSHDAARMKGRTTIIFQGKPPAQQRDPKALHLTTS